MSAASQSSLSPASPATTSSARRRHGRGAAKVRRACDYCKAKKLKCSGTMPCAGCTERRLACAYATAYRRGRAPTPGPGLPTASVSTAPGPGPEAGTEQDGESGPADVDGQYLDQTSNLGFLHRAWARLGLGSSARVQTSQQQQQQQQHQTQHQRLSSAGDAPFAHGPSITNGNDSILAVLPARTQLLETVGFYFDNCVVTYRCLHRATAVQWADALAANVEAGRPLHHGVGHAAAAAATTMLAIATLRQAKMEMKRRQANNSDRSRSDALFCLATSLTDAETGLPTLASAQARLLQVLYLLQTARMNQAWYVFGSLHPIVSALGLHRQSRSPSGAASADRGSYIAAQCRKRTFWTAYTIDKYLAVVLGRPRLYHDDDIDQDMPDRIDDDDNDDDLDVDDMLSTSRHRHRDSSIDCHMESLLAHAALAQLIGRISRHVYALSKTIPQRDRLAAAHRLGRDLHAWHAALPAHLGSVRVMSLIPSFRRQALALRLAYCHAIMHANRPFLLSASALTPAQRHHISIVVTKIRDTSHIGTTPSTNTTSSTSSSSSSSPSSSLQDSISECLGAAKIALEIVDSMSSDGSLFHAFWWTPYATFCALAVVYVWQIQQQQQQQFYSNLNTVDTGTGSGTATGTNMGVVNTRGGHADDDLHGLLSLAQRCQKYLSADTAASVDSPSHRYAVVLEELRKEAELQQGMRSAAVQHESSRNVIHPVTIHAGAASAQINGGAAVGGTAAGGVRGLSSQDYHYHHHQQQQQQEQAQRDTQVAGGGYVTAMPLFGDGSAMVGGDPSQEVFATAATAAAAGDHGNHNGPNAGFQQPQQQGAVVSSIFDGWQTTDWMDLDASAFGPYPDFVSGGSIMTMSMLGEEEP